MSDHLERAQLLLAQERHQLAEKELRLGLAEDMDNPIVHAILALCLAKQDRLDEATGEAQQAIALGPDIAFCYYALADVLDDRNHLDEARQAIRQAIALEPLDPNYHALLGSIFFQERNWQEALRCADEGLAQDGEHTGCTNLRAMALVNLGRKEEAEQTISGALARDPHNAHTHANQGWTCLHRGQPDKALEHFREALRLEPELEWARLGIVEALKARHFVYRQMLRYFLWMSTLSGRAQWGVIIGIYFAQRLLSSLARAQSPWTPLASVALYGLIGFVFLTWIAQPLFDLVLRCNRFGRLALSSKQRHQSNWVGGLLALALVGLVGILLDYTLGYVVAPLALGLIVPVVGVFHCQEGWPRWVTLAAAIAMFTLAATIVQLFVQAMLDPDNARPYLETAMQYAPLFWLGVLGCTILSNVLAGMRLRR